MLSGTAGNIIACFVQ